MRVTGPAVRRRNHAWLQMRSPERRAIRLARRQEKEEDSSDDADTSSGDESVSSIDSSDDDSDTEEPTKTVRPPIASISVGLRTGRGVRLLPTAGAEVATGVTLGAGEGVEGIEEVEEAESESDGLESDGIESDGESSADESTAPPANTTLPPGAAPPPPPPTITSATTISTARQLPPSVASTGPSSSQSTSITPPQASFSTTVPVPGPSRGRSSSLDELVTTLTGTSSLPPVASATTTPSPSVPITGSTQTEDAQVVPPNRQANEREGDGLSVGAAPQSGLSSGAAAGIALGVLAFVGLLAGAALLWRKRRRDSGLPFFPQTRFRLKDDDESHPPSVTGPLPGHVGGHNAAKTNTQIMDDLMKAAYAADNGTNDMEGAYAPAVPKLPPQLPQQQQQQTSVFMDEKAYIALAGPQAPATPKKPVMRWLDEVRTPTQPNGPEIPPSPAMPPSVTAPRMVPGGGGGRVPDPPQQAYFGRDTMTTDTTNTSVRWYG